MRWTWWRARKIANAAAWHLLMLGAGVLLGVILVAFLPGMPWSATVEPIGATAAEALDLSAQRSMASAAWFMVIISAASSSVGAAGLYLIARTLREAKRSADAADLAVKASLGAVQSAKEIGQAQVRAYVSISGCWLDATDEPVELRYIFQNSGQTPASNIWATYQVFIGDDEDSNAQTDDDGETRSDLSSGQRRDAVHALSEKATNRLRELTGMRRRAYFYVQIEVLFDDVFGQAHSAEARYYAYITDVVGEITLYRELIED